MKRIRLDEGPVLKTGGHNWLEGSSPLRFVLSPYHPWTQPITICWLPSFHGCSVRSVAIKDDLMATMPI